MTQPPKRQSHRWWLCRRGRRRVGFPQRRGAQPWELAHRRPLRLLKTDALGIAEQLSGPMSTPVSDAGPVFTEHGVTDLRGQTLSQIVRRRLDIAVPERQAHALLRQCGAALVATGGPA